MNRLSILTLTLYLACVACNKRDLRGTFTASQDGQTYLVVVDDNGGHCGPIKLDGRAWPHAIGELNVSIITPAQNNRSRGIHSEPSATGWAAIAWTIGLMAIALAAQDEAFRFIFEQADIIVQDKN